TATLTPKPTETSTPTVTATPLPDLNAVTIYSVADLGSGRMLVTLAGLPEGLNLDGLEVVVNDIAYSCGQQAPYPDRLYCVGQSFTPGTTIQVEVRFDKVVAWRGEIVVPAPQPTATPTREKGKNGEGNSDSSEESGSGSDGDVPPPPPPPSPGPNT
ncbi:MAG: hypothetical protein JXB38_06795, partial [Anaerolineales bacterium]|nr:hypothetical protein [Anaerolineales bacterium]